MRMRRFKRKKIPQMNEDELMREHSRVAAKNPRLWRRVKIGAAVGFAAAVGFIGFRANVKDAVNASRTTQTKVARVLEKQYDKRTRAERITFRGEKPAEIAVGKTVLTKRDPRGRITGIGKVDVWKGAPAHMKIAPRIPLTPKTAKGAGTGAVAGAAGGVLSFARAKYRRKKRQEQIEAKLRKRRKGSR